MAAEIHSVFYTGFTTFLEGTQAKRWQEQTYRHSCWNVEGWEWNVCRSWIGVLIGSGCTWNWSLSEKADAEMESISLLKSSRKSCIPWTLKLAGSSSAKLQQIHPLKLHPCVHFSSHVHPPSSALSLSLLLCDNSTYCLTWAWHEDLAACSFTCSQ